MRRKLQKNKARVAPFTAGTTVLSFTVQHGGDLGLQTCPVVDHLGLRITGFAYSPPVPNPALLAGLASGDILHAVNQIVPTAFGEQEVFTEVDGWPHNDIRKMLARAGQRRPLDVQVLRAVGAPHISSGAAGAPLPPPPALEASLGPPFSLIIPGAGPAGLVISPLLDGRFTVVSVAPGGQAATAGAAPGDECVAVAGVALRGLPLAEAQAHFQKPRPLALTLRRREHEGPVAV